MTLTDAADHLFTLAELWPTIQAAGAELGFDPQVEAGIIFQESGFTNWRVHLDGTGHGLLGLDDNGLLPGFERWSGLSIGRGQAAVSIPVVPQIRYAAYALADYARRLGGPYAAARAWHRGERLMNDARGQQYEALIRAHVAALFGSGEPTVPTYNPDTPIRMQDHDWDCAEESANWGLHALGRAPSDAWLEQQMLADGIESRDVGLLDGSGRQLAAWITRQYGNPAEGTPTIAASNASNVSFDDVRSVAGQTAVLIGGHGWGSAGHWCGVRRYDPAADVLVLAQPGGTGPVYGQQVLDRQGFEARGPFSMVILTADGAVQPAPSPQPADPKDAIIADLRRQLADKDARLQDAVSKLGYAAGDVASAAEAIANTLRTLKPPAA